MTRRAELAANLGAVRARIDAAARAAGRAAEDVHLVVVTKYFPASDVLILADLGVTDVGENRHQEAEEKAAACASAGLVWHYIGGLQSNKAAAVARYAGIVESVDRAKLVAPLSRGVTEGHVLDVLVQVSLDGPSASSGTGAGTGGRAGVDPEGLAELAGLVEANARLRLAGLMAVAPLGEDPDAAFARLADIHTRFREQYPDAHVLSAGMSGDLEQAIRHGATHVRVGSAVLGPRPVVQ